MRTQIYGITCVEDAVAVADLGADRIGLVVSDGPPLAPDQVSLVEAREIRSSLPRHVTVCMISSSPSIAGILASARRFGPDVLHLTRSVEEFPATLVRAIKRQNPALKIMQAIPVTDAGSVEVALEFDPYVESLLLDTPCPSIDLIGASGRTHDWNISREIVRRCSSPVILAGGLSPENVAAAISAVRPWGVDSFTQTSRGNELPRKDLRKVKDFINSAKQAEKGQLAGTQ